MTEYGWVCLSCGNHLYPSDGPNCKCGAENFLHDHGTATRDPLSKAKRIMDAVNDVTVPWPEYTEILVPLWVLKGLIKRAELAGAVTPGPSARDVREEIKDRMERLQLRQDPISKWTME